MVAPASKNRVPRASEKSFITDRHSQTIRDQAEAYLLGLCRGAATLTVNRVWLRRRASKAAHNLIQEEGERSIHSRV
jgi:formylmethanofuran dehydrogenase subunit E-like metal-binding protein